MSNGFMVVNEKDWEKATPESRGWMVFNTLKSMDARLQKLEKKSLIYKLCAFLGGVIGGAAASVGIKWSG